MYGILLLCYLFVVVGYNVVLFIVGVQKLCGKNDFRNRNADYVHFPMSVMVILWLPVGCASNVTFFLFQPFLTQSFTRLSWNSTLFLLSDNLREYYVKNNVFRIKSGKMLFCSRSLKTRDGNFSSVFI